MKRTQKILIGIAAGIAALICGTVAYAGLDNGRWSGQQVNISLNKLMQLFNQCATGDLVYAGAAQTPGLLPIGTTGQVLTVSGGVPTWAASGTADTGLTANSVPYVGTGGILSQSAANFYFDPTSNANFLRLGSGTAGGALRLLEGSGGGTNYTGWKAASSLAGNTVYQMPSTDGAIYNTLVTDGALGTSWSPTSLWTSNAADFTGSDSASAQPIFEAAHDTITLAANTTYQFSGSYYISTTGTTSHTLSLLFGGTATFTDVGYVAMATNAATNVLGTVSALNGTVATAVAVTPATATATHHYIIVHGLIRTNGAGTLIPQFKWSAQPNGTTTVAKDSTFRLTPVGADTLASTSGWS